MLNLMEEVGVGAELDLSIYRKLSPSAPLVGQLSFHLVLEPPVLEPPVLPRVDSRQAASPLHAQQ